MKQIAIILCEDRYVDYDSSEVFVKSITDWTEVDDETYKLLKQHQFSYDLVKEAYYVVTRPTDEAAFIKKSVADFVKAAEEAEARKEIAREKAREKTQMKKKQREERDAEKRRQQYEELRREFESK
ncbi:hypothetical protein RsoM2USA_163 [Ralstonia phage RsoM2USA]|nr:hypothetical protein RsoM2USA_163 [Ralstonia phage RsoM2USA]